MSLKISLAVSLSVLLCASGCTQSATPQAASSADQVGYAKTVPSGVESRASRYQSDIENAEVSLDENFASFVSELEETDWKLVEEIYEKAEKEGKSRSYSAHRAEAEAVLGFYEAEKKALVGKVAGATHHKAKEERCDVNLYGSIDWSLQKAVVERLVERRREASDAHMLMQREEETLGKGNVKLLEKQVDAIMFTSYMAHVGAKTQSEELSRIVSEGSAAKKALSNRIEEIDEESLKEEQEEREELQTALDALEPAIEKAEAQLKDAEQTEADLEEKFDKAWSELHKELRAKIKGAPEEESSEDEGDPSSN